MKKAFSFFLCLILMFGFVVDASAQSAGDWRVFGGNEERTRTVTDESMGPPLAFKWKLELGWSISQPIIVDNYIYHLSAIPEPTNGLHSGTYLFKIPLELGFYSPDNMSGIYSEITEKGGGGIRLANYTHSRSHPTWSPENQVMYVGIGEGDEAKVVAIDVNQMKKLSEWDVGQRLVSAPHAFPGDIVVFGSQEGKVWAVKGLKTGQIAGAFYQIDTDPSAEITGTSAQVGDRSFVYGLNYRGKNKPGVVSRFTVQDNGPGLAPVLIKEWEKSTDDGIPTNIAFDKSTNLIFFSDKSGGFYSWDATYGYDKWHQKAFFQKVTLVNNSPAVGGSTIYFPVRKPGKMISLDKQTGAVRWQRDHGSDVTNDPTIWRMAGGNAVIMYGDTDGKIHFVDYNGNPFPITEEGTTYIKATNNPSIPEEWWLQGAGLSTEIAIGKKHLLFGVNVDSGKSGDPSDDTGELWAYSLGNPVNLALSDAIIQPAAPQKPGTAATVHVVARNQSKEPVTIVLRGGFLGESSQEIPLTLEPGEIRPVQLNITYPDINKIWRWEINQAHNPMETNYRDNIADIPVRVLIPRPNFVIIPDSVQIHPGKPGYGDTVQVSAEVWSDPSYHFADLLSSEVKFTARGRDTFSDVTVAPNEKKRVSFSFRVPAFEPDDPPPSKYCYVMEVNPNRDQPATEVKYTDNKVSGCVDVEELVNLSVQIIPDKNRYYAGDSGPEFIPVKVRVTNEASYTVNTTLVLKVGKRESYKGDYKYTTYAKNVSLTPGTTTYTFQVKNVTQQEVYDFFQTVPEGQFSFFNYPTIATVNGSHAISETTFSDNEDHGMILSDLKVRVRLVE